MKFKLINLLKSKSLRNSFFTISEASSTLLFVIISYPIFLNLLGAEKYGIYILIQSFSVLVSMFNLGGNFTVTKFISGYRGENKTEKIKEFTSTIFLFQLTVSIILIIIIFPFLNSITSYFTENVNYEIFKNVVYFAIPVFLIDLFEQNFNGLHKGYERFDRALKMTLFSKLIKYSVQIVVVIYLKDLIEVYKFTLLFSLFYFVFHSFMCKKWYNDISFFVHSKWSCLKDFFKFSMWVWAMSIVTLLTSQADKWIVVGLFDLKTLAYYGIGVSIFNQLHMLVSSSVSWLFPKISFNGISDKMLLVYKKSSFVLLFISAVLTVLLLITSDFIFELWLGEEEYRKAEKYIKLFICILPVISTTIIPYYFLLGLGKIKELFLLGCLTSCILISSIYILSSNTNLYLVISSFLIVYLIMSFIYHYRTQKLLRLTNNYKNYAIIFISGVISFSLFYNIL
ncbi:lipopolysaccharide biosynthesis protein [Polaribacter aquimarinus]|uniref:Polysaccharide biosynthesis protein n=1 Tax=Polaribacter aquimarinus TaxID=2100726 RepID=A0A2U2JB97_9FLAO|nr:oligosaccharide flippase family protein [Polaribacter aquimarinus]PWG05604.1 hypothetical protein DIS07_03940 [Polaribacter aquimarinus]